MRRKDGKPKRKARKSLPKFTYGFRNNPATSLYRHEIWNGNYKPQNYSVVSLFAGCGGLDLGISGGFNFLGTHYEKLPFNIICAIDNSEDAVTTYRLNLADHAILADLTKMSVKDIARADVLMGGFPCQDFSSSGSKAGFGGERGHLYQVLTEYMRYHQPKIVIGENVPYLARLKGGVYLDTILKEFEDEGYSFDVWDLYAPDYGLPQSRRRLFLVGIHNDLAGFPVKPKPTHLSGHIAINECISDLEHVLDESVTNQSQYFVASRATSGGGQGDHANQVGEVAYCIRANSRGRIQFHYKLPRRLTVRECARLQSFPDEFVFPFSTQRNLTLIGNAVPPILGHHVALSINNYLKAITGTVDNLDATSDDKHSLSISTKRSRAVQLSLLDLG